MELMSLSTFSRSRCCLLNLQYGDVNEEIKEFKSYRNRGFGKSVDNREDLDGLALS